MAQVDASVETFIAVPPATLAAIVADPQRWRAWWPDLHLTVFMDRGEAGQRWSMTGALVGSCEIWLEPVLDGTLVHYYLRGVPADSATGDGAELPDTPAGWRRADKLRQQRVVEWNRHIWALKDSLDAGRSAGQPPTPPASESGGLG